MWEKVSRVVIENLLAFIIIVGCLAVVIIAMFHPITDTALALVNKYFDVSLVCALGCVFTRSRNNNKQ